MSLPIITFAVQLGSGGHAIARVVAECLGYSYLDWEITSQAATAAGVSPDTVAAHEQSRSGLSRLVDSLLDTSAFAAEAGYVAPGPDAMSAAIGSLGSNGYRSLVEAVVRQVAERGNAVIVGHAGQVVLQGAPDVLKILVCGSPRRRAERLTVQEGLTTEAADRSILKSDKERRDYFRQAYGVELLDVRLYDVTINTDHVETKAAVETILAVALQGSPLLAAATPEPVAELAEGVPAARVRQRVPKTRQQDALHRALDALDEAVAAETGDRAAWVRGIGDRLAALTRVYSRHVRESESRSGTLPEMVALKPRLQSRVSALMAEHQAIGQQLDEFAAEIEQQVVNDAVDVEAIGLLTTRLRATLRLHEAKGSDLLYEAFSREEGAG